MMIEKYILYGEGDEVVAIKFDFRNDKVIVGGFSRFRPFMEKIIQDYFGMKVVFMLMENTQANKIRYKFSLSKRLFDKGIKKLEEHNFIVEQVRSHERIMR